MDVDHGAIERTHDGVIVTVGGHSTRVTSATDALSAISRAEPARPDWITLWSTSLDAIVRWLCEVEVRPYVRTWRDGIDLITPSIDRAYRVTSTGIAIGGRRLRIVLRALSSWVDGGDDELCAAFGLDDTPEHRCSALLEWQRATAAVLRTLGAETMRGSGSNAAHRLWRERYLPPVQTWCAALAGGAAPWGRPGRPWVLPAERTPDTDPTPWPSVERPGVMRWVTGHLGEMSMSRLMPTRLPGDEHIHGSGPVEIAGRVHLDDRDIIDAYDIEWLRHRSAMCAGRAEGDPGWYVRPGDAQGQTGADAHDLRRHEIGPRDHVWCIDISSAYPAAMAELMPWPYTWSDTPDWRPLAEGGPVDGVARVRLRVPDEGAGSPIVAVRVPDADIGSRVIWPRGAFEVVETMTLDTIREVVARGGDVVHTYWYRGMYDGWYPTRDFVHAVHDASRTSHVEHVRNAIKRMSTRLYGRFGMGASTNALVTLADAVARGVRPVMTIGDRAVIRERTRPNASTVPIYAARIEATVHRQLAGAEDDARAWGARVIAVDTDGMLVAAPASPSDPLTPDIPLAWGDTPGRWRVKWRADALVYVRPKMYAAYMAGEMLAQLASGIPRSKRQDLWTT